MEEKESKVEKAITKNKLSKYGATKKTWYSLLSISVCTLFVVVLSLANAVYDPSSLKTVTYWINLIILMALATMVVVLVGATFAYFYTKSDNILFTMSNHFIHNFIAMIVSFLIR